MVRYRVALCKSCRTLDYCDRPGSAPALEQPRRETMKYERLTAMPGRGVLRMAEQLLTERLPASKIAEDGHSISLSGGDGTVTFSVHRHGMETVVEAATDQVRTSRLDTEVQYILTLLPYQPGDAKGREDSPAGLSRASR